MPRLAHHLSFWELASLDKARFYMAQGQQTANWPSRTTQVLRTILARFVLPLARLQALEADGAARLCCAAGQGGLDPQLGAHLEGELWPL
jgi:hypothetical protein